ncbi:hypothetical protein C6N75_16430 [Streptomyces solincola]|uniref:Uncharacterized protein n=1 Tax=Streptomyces solincola TaxID=2100817 RepID=A0A2S9PUQ5_9ACTN|nr:DUF6056 family protein [Streptomyces solincola]PRH78160.1 hypothetical protein C6N75_16430 [Streptomyces solincola]
MAVGASSVTVPQEPGSGPGTGPGRDGGPRTPLGRAWPWALAALPLALLAAASYLGRYVRPSADEWCFLPVVRDEGVLGLVHKFYFLDNGRVANGLLVGAYAEFPVAGHQWYGAVSGLLVLGLLWALTALVLRRAGQRLPRGIALTAAAMATAVILFATPNTYKTFYWPAASVSHTVAPVLAAAAALPLLRGGGRRGRALALAVVLAVGVFLGTLSEEASVVALVVLALTVLLAHRVLTPPLRRYARTWALTGMAGIAAGTLILVTSPGSRTRRSRFGAETTSMLAPDTLYDAAAAFARILATVLTTWAYLGAVAAGVLVGLLARPRPGARRVLEPARPGLLLGAGLLAFLASGYLCTVITYPVFGAGVVTAERTWNDYLVLWVLLLTAAGAFLGRSLRRHGAATALPTALAAALCAVTVVGLTVPLYDLGGKMRTRAERWDRQDARLRAGAAAGERVLPYTPVKVASMLEPFSQDGKRVWPAQCVADYYGLEKVTRGTRTP